MTLSYLNSQASAVADSFGNATASLQVQSGQYWLPTIVHVGTKFQGGVNGAYPLARLFLGASGTPQTTDAIDFTYNATNDSTGILSGVMINPGQQLTVQWFGCLPGDEVFFNVIGVSSDAPAPVGGTPAVPGTRFAYCAPVMAAFTKALAGFDSALYVAQNSGDSWNVNATISGTPTVTISGQPISVNVASPSLAQLVANQPPLYINTTLAASAVDVLLPATPGRTYYLHSLLVNDAGVGAQMSAKLQDTNGTNYVFPFKGVGGTPTNFVDPPMPALPLNGAPLPTGLGVQLMNGGTGSQQFVGYLTYSF